MLFTFGAMYNRYLVYHKRDKNRIGRIEMQTSKDHVRVRWRGGAIENNVPMADLVPVQGGAPTNETG